MGKPGPPTRPAGTQPSAAPTPHPNRHPPYLPHAPPPERLPAPTEADPSAHQPSPTPVIRCSTSPTATPRKHELHRLEIMPSRNGRCRALEQRRPPDPPVRGDTDISKHPKHAQHGATLDDAAPRTGERAREGLAGQIDGDFDSCPTASTRLQRGCLVFCLVRITDIADCSGAQSSQWSRCASCPIGTGGLVVAGAWPGRSGPADAG